MKNTILIGILLLLSSTIKAQWIPDKLTTSPVLSERNSDKFTVNADVVGFLKNNEYFSPIVDGETFPGIQFRPTIAYQLDTKLKAEFGVVGLHYSGEQRKNGTYFINGIYAKLQYAIEPNFNLVFGNYYDGVNHRLIEPLYRWERQLTDKPESGLQLLYDNKRYFVDVWLNWQQFIRRGDSVPEILTFGISSSIQLTKPDNALKISVPFQLLINHQGGQIGDFEDKMFVLGNLVTGFCSEYSIRNKLIKSVGMNLYLAGYYDKIPDESIRPYKNGWGVYPVFTVDASPFQTMIGYWRARRFYSPGGEPLFASFNQDNPAKVLPDRRLVTFKIAYSKQLHNMVALGTQVETYTDLDRRYTDYSFGIYLRFNGTLFSK